MRRLSLALALILLSSCSFDTLRPNCFYKTASADFRFSENPFVGGVDMYAVGKAFSVSPAAPKRINADKSLVVLMVDNIDVMTHEYDLQIDHIHDSKKMTDEYLIKIHASPNQYYKCSRPESFIETDVKQIIGRLPLKEKFKHEAYGSVKAKTVESKTLDIY